MFGVHASACQNPASLPRNPFPFSTLQSKCVLRNFFGPWTAFVPPPPLRLNQKLKIMNLNPAPQPERACVLGAPGAARCDARRVEIFSGDSIPSLLRLASEAPRSFGPLKSGALQPGVNRRKQAQKRQK